jgi:hypothetical protein
VERGGADAAWLSNGTNPAQAVSASLPGDSELPDERPDVPTPKERVAGLFADHAEKMTTPLSEQHGRKIRETLLDEPETVTHTVEVGEHETRKVSKTVARDALPLYAAVIDLLETYEGYRDKKLQMAKGYGDDQEDFLVDLGLSFDPEYQAKTYAKLKALERQFLGGDYPNGGSCEGSFDEPVTALFGLTSTAYNVAGEASSGLRPFVDHDREIREAWSGTSSSVKRSLRYVLEDKLGLSSDEYAWWWQAEPHPGDGPASGYSHSHPVVVLDAAAADVSGDDITAATFAPVVRRHVDECDGAGESAHQITDGEDSAVEVRDGDDIDEFASYVAEYLKIGPDDDLLERSDEYLLWAASQWATSTQKYSKSQAATAAIDADRCEQQWLDPETEQDHRHGERVRPASDAKEQRGIRWVCSECGSHHGINQSEQSLARMRIDANETAATPTVATDGGTDVQTAAEGVDADSTDDSGTQPPLSERWPSATAAASVGSPTRQRECSHDEPDTCPLCATETESPDHTVSGETPIPESAAAPPADGHAVGFERDPQWRANAIIQAWADDDGTPLGAPGGTQFGEVQVPGHDSITDKTDLPYLPKIETVAGPEPWKDTTMFTEADVRGGDVPPPEVVATEWAEVSQSGRRVTPKQWPDDWYARRYNHATVDADADAVQLAEATADRVRELVRTEGLTSPVAVCGRLSIDPDNLDAVAAVIDAA